MFESLNATSTPFIMKFMFVFKKQKTDISYKKENSQIEKIFNNYLLKYSGQSLIKVTFYLL
jgi:hypothetical protein